MDYKPILPSMKEWKVTIPDNYCLGYKDDHLVNRLEIVTDSDDSWDYKLDCQYNYGLNIIQLDYDNGIIYADLTRSILVESGIYYCTIRGIKEGQVRHSNIFLLEVGQIIEATEYFSHRDPTEFEQIEYRLTQLYNDANKVAMSPPFIGENGNWFVFEWDEEAHTGQYVDTGVPASGGGGTNDHSRLINRDLEDQHPISAITGLTERLEKGTLVWEIKALLVDNWVYTNGHFEQTIESQYATAEKAPLVGLYSPSLPEWDSENVYDISSGESTVTFRTRKVMPESINVIIYY